MLRSTTLTALLFLLTQTHAESRDNSNTNSNSVVPVANCAALPNYNNATKIAGPWNIRVDGCSNSDISEPCRFEGFPAGCDVTRSADEKGIEKGSITIIDASASNNQTHLRCNGALNTFEAYVPSGAGAPDWHAIGVNKDLSTGQMEWGYGSQSTYPVQAYREYVRGTPVNGIFLGAEGRTTWAVRESGSGLSGIQHRPFWFLRLLNEEMEMWEDESETRMRIDGS